MQDPNYHIQCNCIRYRNHGCIPASTNIISKTCLEALSLELCHISKTLKVCAYITLVFCLLIKGWMAAICSSVVLCA